MLHLHLFSPFFSNDPPPPHIYTLSLHDALPISLEMGFETEDTVSAGGNVFAAVREDGETFPRSEEHTSELQSRLHLVCRLLLEKKKNTDAHTRSRSVSSRLTVINSPHPVHFSLA